MLIQFRFLWESHWRGHFSSGLTPYCGRRIQGDTVLTEQEKPQKKRSNVPMKTNTPLAMEIEFNAGGRNRLSRGTHPNGSALSWWDIPSPMCHHYDTQRECFWRREAERKAARRAHIYSCRCYQFAVIKFYAVPTPTKAVVRFEREGRFDLDGNIFISIQEWFPWRVVCGRRIME